MNKEQILGIVRHTLTFVGGWLVAKGLIDESTLMDVVGAGVTIAGVVFSFLSKKK